MYWEKQTSPQIAKLDKNIPVVLPIAAIEQHGAHLPLATDRMIGEHYCQALDKRLKDKVLILPTISVGCSEHHTEFPGSLSVQHLTMLQQMTDIANCVIKYGFKNLMVLNSHGGNQAIAGTFLETFGFRNPQCRLVVATWWKIALTQLQKLNESGQGGAGHAGEFETSLMLLIAPELVQKDKIGKKSNVPTFDWAEGDMLAGGKAGLYRTMKAMTPSGVYGDANYGTKKKGKQISKIVVKALQGMVLDLYNATK